jgi:hypothetical protein
MRIDTFRGDFGELQRLIQREWDAYFGDKTHFRYTTEWLAAFFGPAGDLALEHRDARGALTGFIGAVPRPYALRGREVRLGLVTLLTSARENRDGLVGLEIERELFRRARAAGLYGTYHFVLDGQRTPDLLRMAAGVLKTKPIEVAPVTSLLGKAGPSAGATGISVRAATAADAEALAALVARAAKIVPLARVATAADLRAAMDADPPRRTLVLQRDGAPAGLCTYARRQLIGRESTEVANIDLLIAPDATPSEARQYGARIAADAFEAGASYVIAPQRETALFPGPRDAGLRLSPRTLRVFVVPSEPGSTLDPRSAHLLEVE